MNYTEILDRQEELAKEMDALQQARIQCAKDHEPLAVTQTLTTGLEIQIDLNYRTADKDIFLLTNPGEDCGMSFGVEDYNEISQFFSKYNDAIFSYMSEITKDEATDVQED